jgi:hypothetical protein
VRQDTATSSALKMTYRSCHALAGKQPPRQDSRLTVITSPPALWHALCPPRAVACADLHVKRSAINQARDAIFTSGVCRPGDSQPYHGT